MRHPASLIAVLAALVACGRQDAAPAIDTAVAAPVVDASLARAVRERARNVDVQGRGRVERLLRDDADGSRHQRFVLRLDDGTTLLVAHNIDLAPRVQGLAVGDAVEFRGEYVWNEKGGVLHWTHHDPDGMHVGGWLRHAGRTYD
ncbi:MAG TPA: DUF3465 domain-containing protein [Lysobacter sp.]|nr:DUF3465 domain-containing protein [Lysobacter sp.]